MKKKENKGNEEEKYKENFSFLLFLIFFFLFPYLFIFQIILKTTSFLGYQINGGHLKGRGGAIAPMLAGTKIFRL